MDAKKMLEIEAKERTTRVMKKIMAILEEENCTLEPRMILIGGRKQIEAEVLVMANPIKVTPEPIEEASPTEEAIVETPTEISTDQPVEGGTS